MNLTPEQTDEIKQLIKVGYTDYVNASTSNSKYNIIYNIIDMKCQINNYEIYKDLKNCIRHHVSSVDENDYGYDIIEIDKIFEISRPLPCNQRLGIFKTFARYLDEKNFIEEKEKIDEILHNLSIEKEKSDSNSLIPSLKYLKLLGTRSVLSIFIFTSFFLFIEYIFLLPSPVNWMATVKFVPKSYTKNYYVDSIIGIMEMLLSVNDEVKVVPLTWCGATAVILGKTFFIAVIANYFLKSLGEKSKI